MSTNNVCQVFYKESSIRLDPVKNTTAMDNFYIFPVKNNELIGDSGLRNFTLA